MQPLRLLMALNCPSAEYNGQFPLFANKKTGRSISLRRFSTILIHAVLQYVTQATLFSFLPGQAWGTYSYHFALLNMTFLLLHYLIAPDAADCTVHIQAVPCSHKAAIATELIFAVS